LLVAAIAFCFQLPFFDRWFGVMDEGHMLQFADVVASGGMLYRDATSYPLPGAFYLLAGIFQLFEPSILLSRWVVVVEFSAFVAIAYSIVRRATSPLYASLCVLLLLLYRVWAFPHWQMYNYSTTALLVLSASLLGVVRFLETSDRRVLAGAGLVYGLGVFCKQDYGAAMLLAIVFTLFVYARGGPVALRRPFAPLLLTFLGPAAVVGIAAGVHFWMQGQLGFVLQLTVLNHFIGLSTFEYESFPPLLPLFRQDPAFRSPEALYAFFPAIVSTAEGAAAFRNTLFTGTAVYDTAIKAFIYAPPLLVGIGAVRQWRRRAALSDASQRTRYAIETAIVAVAAAFALLISLYRPQDYVHLAVLYWAFIALGVLLLHGLLSTRRKLAWIFAAVALLPGIAATAYTGRLVWKFREIHSEPIPGTRAGVHAKPREARLLGELVDYIHANSAPDDPVAAMPYFPILQFLADRDAPHAASYILWPFPEYPDRDDRIIQAMERANAQLVIYNFTQFPNFPPVPDYAPALFEYLVDHFEIDRVFNDATFGYSIAGLKRQAPSPPGTALFDDAGNPGTVRGEGPGGAVRVIDAERRARWIETRNWPFRPVVGLRPIAGGGRSVLSIPVDVPEAGATLQTSIGVHPNLWFRYPPSWARFEVEVVSEGVRKALFEETLDPQQVLEDRGWFDVEVPLDAYRGRRIDLEFATSTAWPMAESPRMAGWGSPILIERTRGGAE
jgi:hypothetical protein